MPLDDRLNHVLPKDRKVAEDENPFMVNDLFFSPRSLKSGRWAIPWSDLMMTMFILFVVLYVYQSGNRELRYGDGPGKNYLSDSGAGVVNSGGFGSDVAGGADIPTLYDLSRRQLRAELEQEAVEVELVDDETVKIVLTGDLLFDTARAELKPGAEKVLAGISKVINKTNHIVNVVGHTDSVPNHSRQYPTNWELSAVRACMVVRYLVEKEGVAGNRFFVSGHSYHQPIRPNINSKNRALNRRVEILLMKNRPYGMVGLQ